MPINAFDTPHQLTSAVVSAAMTAGRIAAGRYISSGGSWKHLTTAEVSLCKSTGFGLFLIDEGAGDAAQFATGDVGGQAMGTAAAKAAAALGVPAGTPIFIGVDFAADEDAIPDITSYKNGYAKGCAPYVPGMYADGLIASAVATDVGDFVPGASAWPGTRDYLKSGKIALIQHPPVRMFGIDIDPVEVVDSSVLWFPGKAAFPPTPVSVMPDLKAAQAELQAKGLYDGALDGVWGSRTESAFVRFYSGIAP